MSKLEEMVDRAVSATAATPAETTEDAAAEAVREEGAKPAAEPKAAEETAPPAPEAEATVSSILESLSHKQVVQTPAGKGLLAQLKREREQKSALQAQLDALLAEVKPEAEPEEAADPFAGMEEDDLLEVGKAKEALPSLIAREVSKAIAPLTARLEATDTANSASIKAAGARALYERQQAGEIPASVNVGQLFQQAVSELQQSEPDILASLKKRDDPVSAIWNYASAAVPAVAQALGKAKGIQTRTQETRAARGRSPETGQRPGSLTPIIDALRDRNKPK